MEMNSLPVFVKKVVAKIMQRIWRVSSYTTARSTAWFRAVEKKFLGLPGCKD
jgi:hypothetical protein